MTTGFLASDFLRGSSGARPEYDFHGGGRTHSHDADDEAGLQLCMKSERIIFIASRHGASLSANSPTGGNANDD